MQRLLRMCACNLTNFLAVTFLLDPDTSTIQALKVFTYWSKQLWLEQKWECSWEILAVSDSALWFTSSSPILAPPEQFWSALKALASLAHLLLGGIVGGGGVGAVSCIEVDESDMHTVNYVHFTFLQTIQRCFDTIPTRTQYVIIMHVMNAIRHCCK